MEVRFATVIKGTFIRTGVTAIHPCGKADHDPVFGGTISFNGNGEMTGAAWVEEGGFVEGPICITNTHSVGVVRDTVVVLATDAPLFLYQLKRVARRATLGMARTGNLGGNSSGDIFLVFSTANRGVAVPGGVEASDLEWVQILANDHIDPVFAAAVLATEEAILNALLAAETMTGKDGLRAPALPHDRLQDVLRQYNRLV